MASKGIAIFYNQIVRKVNHHDKTVYKVIFFADPT
jgi:hypothetical protein